MDKFKPWRYLMIWLKLPCKAVKVPGEKSILDSYFSVFITLVPCPSPAPCALLIE